MAAVVVVAVGPVALWTPVEGAIVVTVVVVAAFDPTATNTLAEISTAAITMAEAMARWLREAGVVNPKALL